MSRALARTELHDDPPKPPTRRVAAVFALALAAGASCAEDRAPQPEPAGPPAAEAFLPPLEGYRTDDDVDAGEIRSSLDHGDIAYSEVRRRLILGDDGFARGDVMVVTFEPGAGGPDRFLRHWFGDAPREPVEVGGEPMLRVRGEPHDAIVCRGPDHVVVFARGQAADDDWLAGLARATLAAAGAGGRPCGA